MSKRDVTAVTRKVRGRFAGIMEPALERGLEALLSEELATSFNASRVEEQRRNVSRRTAFGHFLPRESAPTASSGTGKSTLQKR